MGAAVYGKWEVVKELISLGGDMNHHNNVSRFICLIALTIISISFTSESAMCF